MMQRRTALKAIAAGAGGAWLALDEMLTASAATPPSATASPTATAPLTVAGALDGFVADAVSEASTGAPAVSRQVRTPIRFSMIGFEVPEGEPLRYRTSVDGGTWRPWSSADVAHVDDASAAATMSDPAWVGPSAWLQVQAARPDQVRAHLIDTSGLSTSRTIEVEAPSDPAVEGLTPQMFSGQSFSAYPRPPIITRAQWGADERITRSSRSASGIRNAIVHHTAGTNDYSRDDSAAIVRGIHRYHVVNRGWGDIGYNFLVDKFGRVYEGRRGSLGDPVIGAHAAGFNTGSLGIAVIGNLDRATPEEMALGAVRVVLAWKFSLHRVDPTATYSIRSQGSPRYPSGTTVRLPAISGHRDTGLTSCPGSNLAARLPDLAGAVKSEMGRKAAPVAGSGARTCEPEGNPSVGPVWRAAGENRVATAIEASRWYWKTADTAVIATANNFPDALAAGALAASRRAPILLTEKRRLHPAVARRLTDMGVKEAFVLGSTAALSAAVDQELRRLGIRVQRLAGANRYETAAACAQYAGAPGGEAVLVAGGHGDPSRGWPDAIAAGALTGAAQRPPVLLTAQTQLPSATAAALKRVGARTVWIVGDASTVSTGVERQVKGLGMQVRRLEGTNRYATSVAVAREARRRLGNARTPLILASGADYPDGLAASAIAARRGAPVLLVPPCGLEQASATKQYLREAIGQYAEAVILGGTAAVSERIRWQVGTEFVRG